MCYLIFTYFLLYLVDIFYLYFHHKARIKNFKKPNKSVKGTRRPFVVLRLGFYKGSAASLKLSAKREVVCGGQRFSTHLFMYKWRTNNKAAYPP